MNNKTEAPKITSKHYYCPYDNISNTSQGLTGLKVQLLMHLLQTCATFRYLITEVSPWKVFPAQFVSQECGRESNQRLREPCQNTNTSLSPGGLKVPSEGSAELSGPKGHLAINL